MPSARSGTELCTKCHLANQAVLVHRIPGHPKDCLACHTPHFTETEIIGDACVKCHQGMFYAGGRNSPKDHRSCENCHDIASFRYKGDGGCANCHKAQGRVISNKQLNIQHRFAGRATSRISGAPRSRAAAASATRPSLVLEHHLPQHKLACDKCHDAHAVDTMPEQRQLHRLPQAVAQLPAFKPNAPEQHRPARTATAPDAIAARSYAFAGAEGSVHGLPRHRRRDAGRGMDQPYPAAISCATPATPRIRSKCCPARRLAAYATRRLRQPAGAGAQRMLQLPRASHKAEFSGDVACTICHSQAAEQAGEGVKAQCTACHSSHEFKADPQAAALATAMCSSRPLRPTTAIARCATPTTNGGRARRHAWCAMPTGPACTAWSSMAIA